MPGVLAGACPHFGRLSERRNASDNPAFFVRGLLRAKPSLLFYERVAGVMDRLHIGSRAVVEIDGQQTGLRPLRVTILARLGGRTAEDVDLIAALKRVADHQLTFVVGFYEDDRLHRTVRLSRAQFLGELSALHFASHRVPDASIGVETIPIAPAEHNVPLRCVVSGEKSVFQYELIQAGRVEEYELRVLRRQRLCSVTLEIGKDVVEVPVSYQIGAGVPCNRGRGGVRPHDRHTDEQDLSQTFRQFAVITSSF